MAAIDKNDGEFKIVNISGSQNLSVGGTASYEMWGNVKCDTAYTASPVLLYEASWKSSNSAVASVDKYGKVTAKAPGSAVITASLGNFSKTVTINVPYKDISTCTASLSTASYVYDGQAKTPAVTVKDSSKTLSNGTDYTVSYSSNVNAGTATVTITGKGSYKNSKVLTFKITPKPQTAAQQTQKSDSSTVSTADKKSDSSKSASDNKSTDSKNSSDNKDNSDSKTDSSSVNGGEISNEKLSNENDDIDKDSDDMIAGKDDDRADKATEDTISVAEEEQDQEGTSDNNSNASDKVDKDNKFPVIPVAAGSAGGLLAVAAIVFAVKKSKSR